MITERCFREGEGISRMDRNTLKVTDQQEVQRRASLGQQQTSRKLTSGIQRSSATQSMVFKEEGMQLETFQSLTFRPEHSREFGTLQDFCSASYNPQLPQYGQRNTQTEIQAQVEVFPLEQTYLNTPLLTQTGTLQVNEITDTPATERGKKFGLLREGNISREKSHREGKENINNPHPRETECRINQSLSKPTPRVKLLGKLLMKTRWKVSLNSQRRVEKRLWAHLMPSWRRIDGNNRCSRTEHPSGHPNIPALCMNQTLCNISTFSPI